MRKLLLLSTFLLGLSSIGHADTFNLVNNTFMSGATATGSINIDTKAGVISSVDVTVTSSGTNYVFTGTPSAQTSFNNGTQYFEYSFDTPGDLLLIDIPGASLVGFKGGQLCTMNNLCGDGYAGYFALSTGPTSAIADVLSTGSLVSAAAPEPSSLLLLGTGIGSLVGVARRRVLRYKA